MIPMAPGFFKPFYAGCISWSEDMTSLPDLENATGTPEPGTPAISSGALQVLASSATTEYAVYLADSPELSNFDLSWDWNVSSNNGQIRGGLFYRTPTPPEDGLAANCNYLLEFSSVSGGLILSAQGDILASTSVPAYSPPHNFRLIVNGSSHKVYVDGTLLIDVTDSSFTTASKIGLNNASGALPNTRVNTFDNVSIISDGCPEFAAGTSDPYYADCILLLHAEGTDGSTTITDSSPIGRSGTASGNAQIKTANSKYGSSSMYFDGVGDFIDYNDSADWDPDAAGAESGYYTWEMWACPDSSTPASAGGLFGQGNNLGGERPIQLTQETGGRWRMSIWQGTLASPNYISVDSADSLSLAGRWDHLAVVLKKDVPSAGDYTWKFFVNGTEIGTGTITDSDDAPQFVDYKMTIGRIGEYAGGNYFKGYIDEVRFTKGRARYWANFTPPTAQFPDS